MIKSRHYRALFLAILYNHWPCNVQIDAGWKRESSEYMKGFESLSLLSLFKGIKLSRKCTVPSAKAQQYVILFSFLLFSVLIAAFKCNRFKDSKIQDSRIQRSVSFKDSKILGCWESIYFVGWQSKNQRQSQISKRMRGFVNKNIYIASEKDSRI